MERGVRNTCQTVIGSGESVRGRTNASRVGLSHGRRFRSFLVPLPPLSLSYCRLGCLFAVGAQKGATWGTIVGRTQHLLARRFETRTSWRLLGSTANQSPISKGSRRRSAWPTHHSLPGSDLVSSRKIRNQTGAVRPWDAKGRDSVISTESEGAETIATGVPPRC